MRWYVYRCGWDAECQPETRCCWRVRVATVVAADAVAAERLARQLVMVGPGQCLEAVPADREDAQWEGVKGVLRQARAPAGRDLAATMRRLFAARKSD